MAICGEDGATVYGSLGWFDVQTSNLLLKLPARAPWGWSSRFGHLCCPGPESEHRKQSVRF